uniref:Uncharacterized protein n=1 Tax=Arundo donax TaxID=35708 RepID=A0A0A9AP02_ARUDO
MNHYQLINPRSKLLAWA